MGVVRGIRVIAILALLLLMPALIETTPPANGQSAVTPEMCIEAPNSPVLNDSSGYTYTTSSETWFAYNNTFQEPTVVRTPEGLRLWYAGYVGGIWGIYTATSKDGGNWTIDTTPVLTSGPNGTWDSSPLMAPSVLYNGTGYMMYFRSSAGSIYTRSIGIAFSSDGIHWKEYAKNPVLKPGPQSYDSNWIYEANVLFKGGAYYMWYAGSAPHSNSTEGYFYYEAIDLATSADGIHWTKYPGNPVFIGAVVGNTTVGRHPDVIDVNGTLLMLYGDGYGIGYAVSTDGVNWTHASSYLIDVGKAPWKSGWVSEPAALLNGTQLTLWYYGESPVGYPWTPYTGGIGFAYCNLIQVQVRTTTTVVTTTISTTPILTSVTATQNITTTRTVEVASPSLGLYQGLSVGLASAVVVLVTLLVRVRRRLFLREAS